MTRPIIRIHNVDADEIIDREMNDEEYAQWQIDVAADKARVAVEEARVEAKVQAVADKAALLAKLGITEAEARLLLS